VSSDFFHHCGSITYSGEAKGVSIKKRERIVPSRGKFLNQNNASRRSLSLALCQVAD
jgi:hypothetical protein